MNTEARADSSEWNGVNHRHDDRRGTPTRPLVGIFGPRRRTQGRRETDRIRYVDRYSRHEAVLILERTSPQAEDHFGANALAVDDYLRPIIRRVDRPEAE